MKNNYFAIYIKNKRYLFLFLDIHCHCHLGFFFGSNCKSPFWCQLQLQESKGEKKERKEGVIMRIQVQIRGLKMSSRFKGELGFSRFSFTFYLSRESLGQSSQYINWGKHRSDPHPSLLLVCSLFSLFIVFFILLFPGWVLIMSELKFSMEGAVMRNRDSHAPLWWCLHQSVLINFSQPIFFLSSFLCFHSLCCIYLGKFLLFFQFVFTSLFSRQSSGSFYIL